MARNPFYSNVDQNVKDELNARGAHYGVERRNRSSHKWSYQKMATATVTSESGRKLAPPPEGGFKTLYGGSRLMPRPILTSVSLTNEGPYGSLQRAEVQFTVYSRGQLDVYEDDFLTPTKKVTIKFGWSVAANNSEASNHTFEGHIYNFNFSLNRDGGFDCSFTAVGEGFFALGLNADASLKGEGSRTDASGVKLPSFNLPALIKQEIEANQPTLKNHGSVTNTMDTVNGFYVRFDITQDRTQEEDGTSEDTKKGLPGYYMSLSRIFHLINKKIVEELGGDNLINNKVQYVCNNTVTRSTYDKDVFSANPLEIIFPDKETAKYGTGKDEKDYSIKTFFPKFKFNDTESNLSTVLVSIDLVDEIFEKTFTEGAPAGTTIPAFAQQIFDRISKYSGGIYNLSLIIDEDEPNLIKVVDTNFTKPEGQIEPYIFKPFRSDSLVREINMSSTLPQRMATAAFVGNSGTDATGVFNPGIAQSTEKETVTVRIAQEAAAINKLKADLFDARHNIAHSGFSTESMRIAQSVLRTYKTGNFKADWNKRILYPLNLSLTIDGISGFKFGNIIGSDWLPSKYRDKHGNLKLVFMITRVEHKIQNNEWITIISTQCRLTV